MADYYTLLTNAGIAYETACKAAGLPIKLSQISVGDGNGAVYNPAATATALKREVWRGPLNALFQDEKNLSWLLAEVVIPSEVGGWYVREAGVWTDTGILYAIVKYPESFKPVLATSGSGKEFYIRAIFETSNASQVALTIDDTIVKATRTWVLGFVADELAQLDGKQSVRVVTTANIGLSGAQQIDGVAVVEGDRVGVVRQTAMKDNGIYIVANGSWVRAIDADSNRKVTSGLNFFVEEGVANAGSTWQLTTKGPIVLGTAALVFEMAAGRTGITSGTYRSLTVDKSGRVTAGTNPTTLFENGITDGTTKAEFADAVGKLMPKMEGATKAELADAVGGLLAKSEGATKTEVAEAVGKLVLKTDGATKTELSTAVGTLVAKSGGNVSGALTFSNGYEDSPEIGFNTPSTSVYIDVFNKGLRAFGVCDGVNYTPFLFNLPTSTAYAFGNVIWTASNFNPGNKITSDSVSAGGLAGNDPASPYFRQSGTGAIIYLATAASAFGVGQAWQDVKSSRVANTNYINSTGRPIQVNISSIDANPRSFQVNGVVAAYTASAYGGNYFISVVVPPGSTYLYVGTFSYWAELR